MDSDHSGYIDLGELKNVSRELGKEFTDAELDECIKDLDENKDGKVSFEEFRHWWLSGRQNVSPLMKRLINLVIKTQKLIGAFSGPLVHALQSNTDADEIGTSSLSVNLNKVEHAGTTFQIKASLLSPEQKESY